MQAKSEPTRARREPRASQKGRLLSQAAHPGCSPRLLCQAAQSSCSARLLSQAAQPGCSARLLSQAAQPGCSARLLSQAAHSGCSAGLLSQAAHSGCSARLRFPRNALRYGGALCVRAAAARSLARTHERTNDTKRSPGWGRYALTPPKPPISKISGAAAPSRGGCLGRGAK